MIEKLIWIEAMTQRPAMRDLTSRLARFSDSRSNRCASSLPRPIVLPSRIPDTDSDSSTRVDMSASIPCIRVVMRRRSLPTRRLSSTKNGSRISEKIASCQLSRNMAMIAAVTVATFETIEVAVEVTTFWMPPMSFAIRDWISPVRVRVKKASESRWRWR